MSTIIARTDALNNHVVFLLDTMTSDGKIQAWWPEEDKLAESDIAFYRTTKSVSDELEKKMAQQYITKFGLGDGFVIRRKLYRQSYKLPSNNNHSSGGIQEEAKDDAQKMDVNQGINTDLIERLILTLSEATDALVKAMKK